MVFNTHSGCWSCRSWIWLTKPSTHHGQLTTTGPYAGNSGYIQNKDQVVNSLLSSFAKKNCPSMNYWASGSHRIIETARCFSAGLFHLNWFFDVAEPIIIPETADLGAETLTLGNICLNYTDDQKLGCEYWQNQPKIFHKRTLVFSSLHQNDTVMRSITKTV